MRATTKLLVAAIAAAGFALGTPAQAASGHTGGGHSGGGHWSGAGHSGSGHWGGGHYGGGHWSGGHWYPFVGFYWGAPFWGWGWPYYGYYDYYYPAPAVVYRDVERYPEGEMSSTQVQRGPGAPTQGPSYLNYCESAKAYYPKVTTCPEGWRLATPTQ